MLATVVPERVGPRGSRRSISPEPAESGPRWLNLSVSLRIGTGEGKAHRVDRSVLWCRGSRRV